MKIKITNLMFFLAAIYVPSNLFAQEVSSSVKVFDNVDKYRIWSVGVHAGMLSSKVFIGGNYDYANQESNLAYGFFVKKQLVSAFGLRANALFGKFSANNGDDITLITAQGLRSFSSKIGYGLDLRAEANLGTINFLKKQKSLAFILSAGYGVLGYATTIVDDNNVVIDLQNSSGKKYRHNNYVPVGLGAKFKASDKLNFNIDYTAHFFKKDDIDGNQNIPETKDKFSYASIGFEYNFGKTSKPVLLWKNQLETLYDELNNADLRNELESLKTRIKGIENDSSDLSKDTDGDGVADHLDRCPNTPAGTVVDGAGCEIKIPETKKKNNEL